MKKILKGYVYGDIIENGWKDTPASGRYPGSSDFSIMIYRNESPGLIPCKIIIDNK